MAKTFKVRKKRRLAVSRRFMKGKILSNFESNKLLYFMTKFRVFTRI